jgi:hypothetical protein
MIAPRLAWRGSDELSGVELEPERLRKQQLLAEHGR